MNYSFWEKNFIQTPTNITIIGAGIVGLSAAISIKEYAPNVTVKIIERGSHPNGASTKNAGFSCFGSVSELLDDFDVMGVESAMKVVEMRYKGLLMLQKRVGKSDLQYQACGGIEIFRHEDAVNQEKCFDLLGTCNQYIEEWLGLKSCYAISSNELFDNFYPRALYNQYEGLIHPVSMMQKLYQIAVSIGVHFVYGVHVQTIDQTSHVLHTSDGLQIDYERLIVCTNGFTHKLLPDLPVHPARNQVLITKPLSNLKLDGGFHMDKGYLYFRRIGDRILLGGGRNIDAVTETTADFGNTGLIQRYLSQVLDDLYADASKEIDFWWSGILGVGPSKYPIVTFVSDDVLVGVRLGGMGIAIGSLLGDMLANKILNKTIE